MLLLGGGEEAWTGSSPWAERGRVERNGKEGGREGGREREREMEMGRAPDVRNCPHGIHVAVVYHRSLALRGCRRVQVQMFEHTRVEML